jgi:hypothetical protein
MSFMAMKPFVQPSQQGTSRGMAWGITDTMIVTALNGFVIGGMLVEI